jgi:deazaflavin-dependent oxidoreductase (nitroreductase family)
MLGRRFLRLTHVGRRSGRIYQTVLEVVGQNRSTNEVIVVAGPGRSAQWYRNLQAQEAIEVAIAGQRFTPVHRELSTSEATAVLADYERRNRCVGPLVQRLLSWLVGWSYDGTESARQRLVAELPLIGLRPARAGEGTASSEPLAERAPSARGDHTSGSMTGAPSRCQSGASPSST